ncbi:hypothetical protein ACS0TY_023567 [Phlomoides rotata]
MADRCFPNTMPDFVPENPNTVEEEERERYGRIEIHPQGTQDSLLRFLSLPYSTVSRRFQRAGLDLKQTVVVQTWGITRQHVKDFTLYCGTLGTAYLLFKSFQVTHNKNDLKLCLEIVKACDSPSAQSRDVTFMCGRAGICALGAVVAKHMGEDQLLDYYLSQYKEIKLSKDHPDELLYCRAGYLWTCLFLNKHFGKETIPSTTMIFGDREFIQAAMEAAEVVWNRGLLKRVGICHGISGNAYVFLSLYRLTGINEYLYRAKAFACFLLDRAHMLISTGEMDEGDNAFSVFEGIGGMAHLFLDMVQPKNARFPGYEL